MRFIAVGDIHIKVRKGIPFGWQMRRYRQFFKYIITECLEKGAKLLIAGDTLDSTDPSKEELQLFLGFLHDLKTAGVETFIVSGNHETIAEKVSILDFLELNRFPNLHYGTQTVALRHQGLSVELHMVNHDEIHKYQPDPGPKAYNILLSHFRCNVNQFIRQEVDVDALTSHYNLAILGDIHEPLDYSERVYYTNNPVNKEFERDPLCGYLEIEIGPKNYAVHRHRLDLPALRKATCSVSEWHEGVDCSPDDYYRVEVSGTPEELRTIKLVAPNVKVDKVPVTVDFLASEEDAQALEAANEAQPAQNLDEELIAYLKVKKYTDKRVSELMEEFRR